MNSEMQAFTADAAPAPAVNGRSSSRSRSPQARVDKQDTPGLADPDITTSVEPARTSSRSRSPRADHQAAPPPPPPPTAAAADGARGRSATQGANGHPPTRHITPPPALSGSVFAAPQVLAYTAVEKSNWVVKQMAKNNLGSPTVCIYDERTRTAPVFCLYSGAECGTVVFPLEPRKEADLPAFMTGGAAVKKVESLDLTTTLEGEQVTFVKGIDDWCKDQAFANSKDWFGRTCSRTELDFMYSSPIKVDENGKYAPNIRAKLNLSGIDKFLTQVTYVRSNGVTEEGAGWDFVSSRLGAEKWRQHRVRLVLEARRIWIVGKKFGLTYSITDIAVREKCETRPNPFANDNSVEQLSMLSF